MLAMQYSFTLPADFDMEVIRQRVAAKGPLVDGPGIGIQGIFVRPARGAPTGEPLRAVLSLGRQRGHEPASGW